MTKSKLSTLFLINSIHFEISSGTVTSKGTAIILPFCDKVSFSITKFSKSFEDLALANTVKPFLAK